MGGFDVKELQANDEAEWEKLSQFVAKSAVLIGIRLGLQEADAKNAAQEALVRLHRIVPKAQWETLYAGYVVKLVRNCCIDIRRRLGAGAEEPMEDFVGLRTHRSAILTTKRRTTSTNSANAWTNLRSRIETKCWITIWKKCPIANSQTSTIARRERCAYEFAELLLPSVNAVKTTIQVTINLGLRLVSKRDE